MSAKMQEQVRSKIVEEPGRGTLEVFTVDPSEQVLFRMIEDIYKNYWKEICFGILVQGGVWEIMAPNAPKRISLSDGYVTVDFGAWHFHICIGETKGSSKNPTPPEVQKHRRTRRAELYRTLNQEGIPGSWGLRMFNGKNEQQMTVFLPNPFLSSERKIMQEPDWSHLNLWDHLRKEYLGLDPDPKDRQGKKFNHG